VTIALRIEPEDQMVDPGLPAVFTVHVVNQSGVVDRVALDILGTAGAWATTEPKAVALFPGTDATATVSITPPVGTPLGPVPIGIRATAETSGFVVVGEANLNVGASRSVQAELRPHTATGKRRATSVIVLHNVGNAPTKVQVVATDPDDAIVFDAPRAVQIGPGMTAELPLRMRLPSREKQGATLPYSVLVEGGDHGQSLDGQVRQPAKKRWPLLAAAMLAALLVAALVLFRPQDSKAITAGKSEDTTTTILGATTTVVNGTTTLPPGVTTTGPPDAGTTAKPGSPTTQGNATVTTKPIGPIVTNPPNTGVSLITTTTVPLPCPAKGTPQATAQRVICAWELGRLGEVSDSTTAEAVKALAALTPIGGQKALTPPPPVGGVTTVSFGGCVAGKGVASVDIPVTTPTFAAGRVYIPVTACQPKISVVPPPGGATQ